MKWSYFLSRYTLLCLRQIKGYTQGDRLMSDSEDDKKVSPGSGKKGESSDTNSADKQVLPEYAKSKTFVILFLRSKLLTR